MIERHFAEALGELAIQYMKAGDSDNAAIVATRAVSNAGIVMAAQQTDNTRKGGARNGSGKANPT